jgi:MSHA biogenesis protein MshN
MSVINQMLLDLERRRAEVTNRGPIDFVRALPDGRDRRPFPWVLAVGVVVGMIAIGALGLRAWQGVSAARTGSSDGMLDAPAGKVTVPAPAVAVAPVPAMPAAVVASPEVSTVPVTAQTEGAGSPAETPAGSAVSFAPRLSLELQRAPDSAVAEVPLAAEQSPTRRAEQAKRSKEPKVDSRRAARPDAGTGADTPLAAAAAVAPVTATPLAAREEPDLKQVSPEQQAENEFRRGSAALGLGRDGEARDAFARTLALSPSHDGARQALVGLFIHGKRNADAERLLLERLAKDPGHAGFAMTAARLQMERGDLAAAIETLRRSQPAARGNADYAAFIAALYQRSGRHADAIEQYEAALRARPAAGVWWMGMGISLQAANRGAEAGEAFRRAKGTNTLNPELVAFVDERLRQVP